jgi:hypothetical protein
MANNPNPNQNLMSWYSAQRGVNPAAFNSGATHVNMGETAAARTYIPMTGNQTQVQALGNARRATQMWTVDAAKGMYKYQPPEVQQLIFDYTTAQLGHSKHNEATRQAYYERAVDGAAQEGLVMGGDPIDLMTYMAREVQSYLDGGGSLKTGSGGGGGGGGGPSTSTQVQLTNESDAAVLVDQALNTYLGRQANDQEREQFWKLLNKRQAANPTVTRNSGGKNNSSVTTGGLNAQQAAREFALSRDDAAEYMANTQYTDWLMEKIAADPTEGIASGL